MKQGFGAAMERTEDLMNKSVSDWETLIDNFFNTSEKDALTDATKNGYLVLPTLNPFLISVYFDMRQAQGLPVVCFGSGDRTGPWIVVASSDPYWLREAYEAVLAVGSDVDTSTLHRGSFSASMEHCPVSLEEFAKELIGVPEQRASAVPAESSARHATRECIHRPRNISNS